MNVDHVTAASGDDVYDTEGNEPEEWQCMNPALRHGLLLMACGRQDTPVDNCGATGCTV